MDDHAKCLCCSNGQSERRTVEFYPVTDEILEVRELDSNEVSNFDASPLALHEQVLARSQGLHPFREACHELLGACNGCLPGDRLNDAQNVLGTMVHLVQELLDVLFFPLAFSILLGKQFRLGGELFVGLLKLSLARLQLDGQPLGLAEQAFRAHCRLYRIEDCAHTDSKLVEEGKVDLCKAVHCRQLNDRFRLVLE